MDKNNDSIQPNAEISEQNTMANIGSVSTSWGSASKQECCSHTFENWMRRVWASHFVVSLLVLFIGCMNNQQRKYIYVKSPGEGIDCERAFMNVFALSSIDYNAVICAEESNDMNMPSYLPFSKSLSKFPQAWILPLFPFIIRGLVLLFQLLTSQRLITNHKASSQRLCLYVGIMTFRGVVLFLAFNAVEDLISKPKNSESCWYDDSLQQSKGSCYGRSFDFSDHFVLYFAQYLPIALLEVLHSFEFPFWKFSSKHILVPALLAGGLLYLYLITLLSAYKTATYFHTPVEVIIGMIISMLVQLPLCYLQCSMHWGYLREVFFGYPR